jgi:hypothetical protein
VADPDSASADGPGRRRESWSLRTIVENVAGRPLSDFQDPARPVHPYVAARLGHLPPAERPRLRPGAPTADGPPDPVDRFSPPLIGATGRALHGAEHEHHAGTLASLGPAEASLGPGSRPHAPGPSRRPERIYLHYLLLHLDRLSDHALRYLSHAVTEELTHRDAAARSTAPPEP